jgi:hypothetical protein
MSHIIEMTGKRFGRLTVIERDYSRLYNAYWWCKCDCGNILSVHGGSLRSGLTKSCNCLQSDITTKRNTTHGLSHTSLYHVYHSMKQRCYCKNDRDYIHYGARGIKLCDEWLGDNGFISFYDWANKSGYSEGLTIERNDVNGNYDPNNCRWITIEEQAYNRTSNRYITYNGKTQCLEMWAKELGFNRDMIYMRIKREWNIDKALMTPPIKK